jgi:hypothetical protein
LPENYYEKISKKKSDDIGYEEAIIAQAHQGHGRARPRVVFTEQPDSGNDSTGKLTVSDELRGKPDQEEKKASEQ